MTYPLVIFHLLSQPTEHRYRAGRASKYSVSKRTVKKSIFLRLTRHHDGLLLPLPQSHHRVRQEGQELLFK